MNYAETAERLAPYLTKYFRNSGSSQSNGNGLQQHALDGSAHTGTLADSQAPQFALLDGTRAFTGNITFSGAQTVDGVDLSAHVLNASAHHAPVTVGDGITLSGQQVSIAPGSGISVTPGTVSVAYNALKGLTVNGSNQLEVAIDTSKGLQFVAGLLAISAGNGLELASSTVRMGTPTTLTVSTINGASGSTHQHAITWSSNPGANSRILGTDASGYLTLVRLAATERVTTPLVINSGAMTIQTTSGDLTIDPSGNVVFPNSQTIRTTSFSSGLSITGFQINEVTSGTSALTIGVISVDELRAKIFVADEVRVDRGEQVWARSFGIVETEFDTPASTGGNGVAIWFEDSPAIAGAIFTSGDWIRFRIFDNSSGLTIANIWGQVYSSSAGGVPGYSHDAVNNRQQWRFVLRSGSTSYTIKKGNTCIDYGASGQPYIFLSAVDPAGAPYIKFQKWSGSDPYTAANVTTQAIIGNLHSVFGTPDENGIAAGNGFATTNSYIRMSNQGVFTNNVNSTWASSGTTYLTISAVNGVDFVLSNIQSVDQKKSITWNDGSNDAYLISGYTGTGSPGNTRMSIGIPGITNKAARLELFAVTNSTYDGQVIISSSNGSEGSYINVKSGNHASSDQHIELSANAGAGTVHVNAATFDISRSAGSYPTLKLQNSSIEATSNAYGSNEYLGIRAYGSGFNGGRVRLGNTDAFSTYIDNLGVGIGIDRTATVGISRLSTQLGGATSSLVNSGYGYGSALLFNAALQYTTAHMYQSGMCSYLGAQYSTTNQTRPGMFYYDANAGYFGWYIGEDALTQGNAINSWAMKFKIDKDGNTYLGGATSPFGGKGVLVLKSTTVPPGSTPTGHGVIWVNGGGALLYRGSSGSVTTLAPA